MTTPKKRPDFARPDAGFPTGLRPRVVSPANACQLLDCGLSRLYEILPELTSYRDGKCRKITVESIDRYIARKIEGARQ
jgi:hypothetical protein